MKPKKKKIKIMKGIAWKESGVWEFTNLQWIINSKKEDRAKIHKAELRIEV